MDKIPRKVYFYCKTSVFNNIIENKTLWLSDINKSTDSLEQKWFTKLIFDNLPDILRECYGKILTTDNLKINLLIQKVRDMLLTMDGPTVWCMCFSRKKDNLGQWRGYGDDGQGVSIGFDTKYFLPINNLIPQYEPDECMRFDKIEYGNSPIKRLLTNAVKIKAANYHFSDDDIINTLFPPILFSFTKPFYKNDAFKEEAEWRIAYYSKGIMPDFDAMNKKDDNFSKNFLLKKIAYMSKSNDLVSHIELEIRDIKRAIKNIIIGPRSNLTIQDVYYFLYRNDIKYTKKQAKRIISKSNSSYR